MSPYPSNTKFGFEFISVSCLSNFGLSWVKPKICSFVGLLAQFLTNVGYVAPFIKWPWTSICGTEKLMNSMKFPDHAAVDGHSEIKYPINLRSVLVGGRLTKLFLS